VVFASGIVVGWSVAQFLGATDPIGAVGSRVIDHVPAAVKDWAIRTFGTSDKVALEVGIVVLLLLVSFGVGVAARRRPPVAQGIVVAMGVVGMLSAKGTDGIGAYVPALVGTVVSLLALWFVTTPPVTRGRRSAPDLVPGLQRRDFMIRASAVGAATATVGAIGYGVRSGRVTQLNEAAAKISLPTPQSAAPVVGADAAIGHGVEPFITPNDSFYRIDTALSVPRIDLADWRLRIDGMVDHPLTLTFDQLLDLGVVERIITMCCVSNEVGGKLIGNARWLGVPLTKVLEKVGVQRGATQVASESDDGWTCGFPTSVALDGRDALIAVGMNGEPLPPEHGFPVRLVVPGLYGYVSSTKWLTRINLTTMEDFEGYWIPRGWSQLGPVKTQSRIDVPRTGTSVSAGRQVIAGVAWAQHRGISKVEARVDDGDWMEATLSTDVTDDAWRQWVVEWDAVPGDHKIYVRATDSTGVTQPSEISAPDPDGATGWHSIRVSVS